MTNQYLHSLEELAAHHATQAAYYSPFGASNAVTVFHARAAELIRDSIACHTEADRMRSALEDVYVLACGPPGTRTKDFIRKKCMSALAAKQGDKS